MPLESKIFAAHFSTHLHPIQPEILYVAESAREQRLTLKRGFCI